MPAPFWQIWGCLGHVHGRVAEEGWKSQTNLNLDAGNHGIEALTSALCLAPHTAMAWILDLLFFYLVVCAVDVFECFLDSKDPNFWIEVWMIQVVVGYFILRVWKWGHSNLAWPPAKSRGEASTELWAAEGFSGMELRWRPGMEAWVCLYEVCGASCFGGRQEAVFGAWFGPCGCMLWDYSSPFPVQRLLATVALGEGARGLEGLGRG